ncbi:hypothetical protein niasHT_032398 [Heterodera trifolii]|uniref:polynucleotide adenylyltransferase n=1 Tax=Heterodera trifolii TaxID=157864 RepID=A0ABD2IBT5_9BILA
MEFFGEISEEHEELMMFKIALYTHLYMLRWKVEQNKGRLEKIKVDLQYKFLNVQRERKSNFYKEFCQGIGEVHIMTFFKHDRIITESHLSSISVITQTLCYALKLKFELLRALSSDPIRYAATVEKPNCENVEESKEIVQNNWDEILEWILSDLLNFFLTRKKLVKFFDEMKKRADFDEIRKAHEKLARLLGFPRMAMLLVGFREQLDFLFCQMSTDAFYANLYQSFLRDRTALGKWRTEIVLAKFLYDDYIAKIFMGEFFRIATDGFCSGGEDDDEFMEMRTEIIDDLKAIWLYYLEGFWTKDKEICGKIEQIVLESKGKAAKIEQLIVENRIALEKKTAKEKQKEFFVLWENGPEDVTLLKALKICAEESFDEMHKMDRIKNYESKKKALSNFAESIGVTFIISEQKWEMTGETSGKNEGSDENSTKSAETRRSLDEMINPKQNLTVISDHCLPFLNNAIETDFFEFKVKKVSKFSDDNYLKAMYQKLIDLIKSENSEKISKIENPTVKSLLRVLDIGIYVNQIYQRIKAANQLKEVAEKQHFQLNPSQKFSNHFDGILSTISKIDLSKGTDMRHLLKTVHLELKQLIIGPISVEEKGKSLENEICNLSNQMHLRNFVKFIIKTPKSEWEKLDKICQKQILLTIIKFGNANKSGKEEEEEKNNYRKVFEAFAKFEISYEKFEAQRKLDQHLLNLYQTDKFLNEFIEERKRRSFSTLKIEEFPELLQEIKFIQRKDTINEMLTKTLENDEFMGDEKEHFSELISELQNIIEKWSEDAKLETKNANFIKNKNENFQPICLLPEGFNRQKIFGTVQFEHSKKNGCQNGSLYCVLCNNLHTLSIQKYEKDEHLSVPTLKMVFMGVHILIPFIFVPILKHLPIGKYNAKQIERIGKIMAQKIENLLANDNLDEAQHKFEWIKRNEQMQEKNEALSKASKEKAVEIEEEIKQMLSIEMLMEEHKRNALINREKVKEMKAMLTILSDYGSDIKILNFLLTDNEIGTDQIAKESKKLSLFLQANAYLEQWAKNKNIYSTEMGFLDTKMLKIMLTKVFLLYPTASSLPFIIHKFFLTFSTWHWPLPVQLEMVNANQKSSGAILIWSPGREWTKKQTLAPNGLRKVLKRVLTMPIIRPMFPEENLGQEINLINAQVIRWKMREAIIHLWHGNDLSALNEELNKPTEFIDTVFEQFSVNF